MSAYDNFLRSMKSRSNDTLLTYEIELKLYLGWQGIDNYDDLLIGTPKELEDKIINYLDFLGSENLSNTKANKLVSALQRFFLANRIVLNWKYIRLFLPKLIRNHNSLLPYPKADIQKMIDNSDLRLSTVINVMASGGLRIGALPGLKIGHMLFLEDPKLYAIRVYAGEPEEYITFVTPQCSERLTELIGRNSNPNSYLFKNKRESDLAVSKKTLQSELWDKLIELGLREPNRQSTNQLAHGFRKFFRTQLSVAGITQEHAEYLMGHIGWLIKTYSKPDPKDVFTFTNYSKAIPYLTF